MDNYKPFDLYECKTIGLRTGVLCAGLGAVMAFLMLKALGLVNVTGLMSQGPGVMIGLVVLFWAAALLGRTAGGFLADRQNDDAMNAIVGIGVAFGSIMFASLSGSLMSVVFDLNRTYASGEIIFILFMPLLLILLWGGIPAICLGFLYGFLVRKQIARIVTQLEPD